MEESRKRGRRGGGGKLRAGGRKHRENESTEQLSTLFFHTSCILSDYGHSSKLKGEGESEEVYGQGNEVKIGGKMSNCILVKSRGCEEQGFDAIGEHTGAGHDCNVVVPFGGKPPCSEGPGHNRLPAVPFGDKIAD
ncbi:hypothetical protein M5K25_026875 [Dendrobium thyrsiflorum]|uniref:Uncharacterized protein n=1 Tax=Dendrobium thyrsiflorum TaxID=117978 RepID=A0ABD0TYC9_DENTH